MIHRTTIAILLFCAGLLVFGCSTNRNAVAEESEALEIAIYREVNRYRTDKGLAPLSYDYRVAEIAREHSLAMADEFVDFSHTGATERAVRVRRLIPRTGRISENLAWSTPRDELPPFFVDRWSVSESGHNETMLGGFTTTGVGVAIADDGRIFVTQLFVASGDVIG